MDQTVVHVREQIFGARNLTTQDVIDHFLGNVKLAEAYLNGKVDWAGNIILVKVSTERAEAAEHFQSDRLAELYLNGLIDWDGNPVCEIHGKKPCHCFILDL